MKKNKLCLVSGATGAVGQTLVRYLIEEGFPVRVLIQTESEISMLPDEVACIVGDINSSEQVQTAVSGVDYVFHLAAKLHINNPDPSLRQEYERVNVTGTKNIIDSASTANVERFIFFSTINVYGTTPDGNVLDEKSPLKPESFYAETKIKAEQLVLNAKRENDGKPFSTILRLAAVYGPQMKGNYTRVIKGLSQGWFFPIGKSLNRRTLIYDYDLARAAVLIANHPDSAAEIFNISDGKIYTMQEIVEAICKGLNKRSPMFHFPEIPVRIAAYFIELFFGLIGRNAPVNRDTVDKMLEDRAVSSEKIQKYLGFESTVSLDTGWELAIKGILAED